MQIQATFAEMERNIIRQRVKEGIAAAWAQGRKGGRPRIMTAEKLRFTMPNLHLGMMVFYSLKPVIFLMLDFL